MEIRFDRGPLGNGTTFDAPIAIIRADSPRDVAQALMDLETAQTQGHWLAGYASYELGYALEPRLADKMPENRELPLLYFGVFAAPSEPAPLPPAQESLSPHAPLWGQSDYTAAFDQVNAFIGSGDIYQANLTFPLTTNSPAQSLSLYSALVAKQPVKHGAFLRHDDTTLPDILSRSPELFFRINDDRTIETRPMKGTQPRGATPAEDIANKEFLTKDEKNRAENLMIVDLLRNDISRVAQTGSVEVPDLFEVETYATVHQMVSQVRAKLRPDAGLATILRALFPCGSITGAPKIRSMEILADLEPTSRDIYCGSIGWAAPDGRAEFNVAIRTLLMHTSGDIRFNVGGGVVWDSTADSEYQEALWKSRFAQFEEDK